MNSQTILQVYNFIKVLNDFKSVERLSIIKENGRRESDAEHTWHLVMAIWLLSQEHHKPLDLLKCIKLALVHDLVELYAGDVYAFDPTNKRTEKEEKEQHAIQMIGSQLPDNLSNEIRSLWNEYEQRETEEGRFVWGVDKLMPRIQYIISKGDLSDNLPNDPARKSYQEDQIKKISPIIEQFLDLIKAENN